MVTWPPYLSVRKRTTTAVSAAHNNNNNNKWIQSKYQTEEWALVVGCRYTFLSSNCHKIVGCCLSLYFFVIKLWLVLVVVLFCYQTIIKSLAVACRYIFCYQTIIKSTCRVHSRVQWNTTRVTHPCISHALVVNLLSSHPIQGAMPSCREIHPHRGRPSIAAKNKGILVTRSLNKCLV